MQENNKSIFLNLLRANKFQPLFITQFLEALNDNLIKNALILVITYLLYVNEPSTATMMVAAAAAIFIFPYFLLSAIAGQIADKYDKAILIRIIKVFEILSMSIAAFGFYQHNIIFVFISLLLLGIHSTFFGPIKYSILPQHLKRNELVAGNSLIEAGTFMAILLGTILGTEMPLIAHVSLYSGAFIIGVIGLLLAVIGLIVSFKIPPAPSIDQSIKVDANIFKSTYDIIYETKKNKPLFLVILGLSWFWLIGTVFITQFPNFAKHTLYATSGVYTFFLVLFSIGIAVGAIISEKIQKHEINAKYVPFSALGMSVCMYVLYLFTISYHNSGDIQTFYVFISSIKNIFISLDIFTLAIISGLYTVPLYAMMQDLSAEAFRSRVIAANNILNALFMVIGTALIFILNGVFNLSIPTVFLIVGLLNLFVAFYICKLLPQELIRLFFKAILKSLYKVQVEGIENFNKSGENVVVVSNHTSFLDGLLLAVFLPQGLLFVIDTAFSKKWWIKAFSNVINFYPIDPLNPMSTKAIIREVKNGKKCVIFPEGRLTMTGSLMKINNGPGVIADKANAKILPIKIEGALFTPFTRAKGKVVTKWFPRVTIKILEPTTLNVDKNLSSKEKRLVSGMKLYSIMTDMIYSTSMTNETLFEGVISAKKMHGGKNEIIEDVKREPMSYGSLLVRSFILGNHIKKNDPSNQNIGIFLPNVIATVTTFFAILSQNKTAVMLNYSTGISNILHACEISKLNTIYTSLVFVKTAKLTEYINELLKKGINIIYLESFEKELSFGQKLIGLYQAKFPRYFYKKNNTNIDENNPAVILFTSGSEGKPKGVVLSHKNIQSNRMQLSAKVDFNKTDIVFNMLPLFHSFGLTGAMMLPILSGVKVFLYPSPLHYKIIPALVYDTNSTILFGTDTFLNNYANHADSYDFYSVRYVFSGAEKLKPETQKLWNDRFGIRIFEGYGATETSPVISTNTPMDTKIGTVGKFLSNIEYKIEKIPGIEQGGKLLVKGENIMLGYLASENIITNHAVASLDIQTPTDGWYDTGDIVEVDDEGFLKILGRHKRFAKIAGEMVSLAMVENEISKFSQNFSHVAIATSDEKKGEKIILVTEDKDLEKTKIIDCLRVAGISELCLPKEILYIQEIPKLATGKVDNMAIKKIIKEN